jgi:hypothetical protein
MEIQGFQFRLAIYKLPVKTKTIITLQCGLTVEVRTREENRIILFHFLHTYLFIPPTATY